MCMHSQLATMAPAAPAWAAAALPEACTYACCAVAMEPAPAARPGRRRPYLRRVHMHAALLQQNRHLLRGLGGGGPPLHRGVRLHLLRVRQLLEVLQLVLKGIPFHQT